MSRATALRELRGSLGAIALCEAVGGIGGLAGSAGIRDWLPQLDRPAYQPPDWVFGPVWTILYALMGVSLRLTWRGPRSPDRDRATRLFAVQLGLNALWTFVFFGLRSPAGGLVDAAALLVAVALTVRAMWPVSRVAALLLVPYLAWVAFATVLTAGIWRRNR